MSIKNPPKSGGLNESDGKIVPNVLIPPDKEKLEILIGDSIRCFILSFLELTVMVKQINQYFKQNPLFQSFISFQKVESLLKSSQIHLTFSENLLEKYFNNEIEKFYANFQISNFSSFYYATYQVLEFL